MYQCEPLEDCVSFLFLGRAYQGAPNEIVFRDYCEDSLSKKQVITQLFTEIDSNPLRFRAKMFKSGLTKEQLDQFYVFCGPKVGACICISKPLFFLILYHLYLGEGA